MKGGVAGEMMSSGMCHLEPLTVCERVDERVEFQLWCVSGEGARSENELES